MTRTTLKAIWVGGGGLLATWLAVTPNQMAPAGTPAASAPVNDVQESQADLLHERTMQLREHTQAARLPPAPRNPFRFGRREAAGERPQPADRLPVAPGPAMVPAPEAPPGLTLSGVAESTVGSERRRTAVISSEGEIFLVHEGDQVGGLYTVVAIDPEAVLLKDAAGAERRLLLPQ